MANKSMEPNELPVADFGAIIGASAENTKWVEIPEWNARVKMKALTKAEQIRLRKVSSVRGQVEDTKLEQNLLVAALVEPRLTFDQIDELYAKADSKAVNRLVAAALALSGLTEDYIGEAEQDMKS